MIFKANKSEINFLYFLLCLCPFIGFVDGVKSGVMFLIFTAPFALAYIWLVGGAMLIDRDNTIEVTNQSMFVSSSKKTFLLQDIKNFRIAYIQIGNNSAKRHILVADFHDISKYEEKKSKLSTWLHNMTFKGGIEIEDVTHFEEGAEDIAAKLNSQLPVN